jgi:hypothetical protein
MKTSRFSVTRSSPSLAVNRAVSLCSTGGDAKFGGMDVLR